MDAETKQLLKELCAVLRDTTEQAYRVHEMAERTYAACVQTNPVFQDRYQLPLQQELQHIADSKKNLISRLDEIIRRLS